MSATEDKTNETPTNTSSAQSSTHNAAATTSMTTMALNIRSLQHQTKPVTVSRDASVLDLKQAVQIAFQVESQRQRLIFKGQVLKDEKNLMDYANLDNGTVVHLVVRPADAPLNPLNDEPRAQNSNNRRALPRGIPRMIPFNGRFPITEGYTFITLDVTEPGQSISSLMDGLTGGAFGLGNTPSSQEGRSPSTERSAHTQAPITSPTRAPPTQRAQTGGTNTTFSSSPFPSIRPFPAGRPFDFILNSGSFSSDTGANNNASDFRLPGGGRLPFSPSIEARLMRTMSCIRNVRTILDAPLDQVVTGITMASTTPPEQTQEIRSRLRSNGQSQAAAVSMVLDELADLTTDITPRLRQVAEELRDEGNSQTELHRRVLRTARIVQGLSLIHHFLGSVLAGADISPRRPRSRVVRPSQRPDQQQTDMDTQPSENSQESVETTTNTMDIDTATTAPLSEGQKRKWEDADNNESDGGPSSSTSGKASKAKTEKGKGREQ